MLLDVGPTDDSGKGDGAAKKHPEVKGVAVAVVEVRVADDQCMELVEVGHRKVLRQVGWIHVEGTDDLDRVKAAMVVRTLLQCIG